MRNLALFPYKMGSRSATALARALDIPQIKHEGSKFKGSKVKTVINWGAGKVSREVLVCNVLNHPSKIGVASNKLSFFKKMTDAPKENQPRLVPWTTSQADAQKWSDAGKTVVVRESLTGHSGRGIIIVEKGGSVPKAPLYTQYIFKDSEWRIHIMKGKIIFQQRKIKDPDIAEPKTWKIRSHDNGFIFQHNDLNVPKDVEKQAMLAFNASGLDFCGVDVIFSNKSGHAYILEVNSAVGLEGTTVGVYADAFRTLCK